LAVTASPTAPLWGSELAVTLPLATPFETNVKVKSRVPGGAVADEQLGQSLTSAYSQWPVPAAAMSSFSSCFNQVPTNGAKSAARTMVVVAISDVVTADADDVVADAEEVVADAEGIGEALLEGVELGPPCPHPARSATAPTRRPKSVSCHRVLLRPGKSRTGDYQNG
jgi:hypothetical protein